VNFATVNGTAVSPADYRATNGTATFAANVASKTILIPIVNNAASAGNKSFNLKLSGAVGAIYGDVTNATISILAKTNITFSAVSFTANKTNANALVTILRNGDVSQPASVDISTVDVTVDDVIASGTNGTATTTANDPYTGNDYDPSGYGDYQSINNTVNFPAGSGSQTVSIPLINNPLGGIRSVDRGSNRWFACRISNPQGIPGTELGSITTARVDIQDTLKHGTIQFSAAHYTNSATGGLANITINRTGGSDGIVVAHFNPVTSGDTAIAGTDFDTVASNTFESNELIFNPGETSKIITLTLFVNNGTAYPKTAHIKLNDPSYGATFGSLPNSILHITP
jgi:hypothetical protein